MPGQAIVKVNDKQWTVSVASTPTELQAGLSGVESLPANTGMLFDLGYDQGTITISTLEMLFTIDILFIHSDGAVVGRVQHIPPGYTFSFTGGGATTARYFMEVNAGELDGVEIGMTAVISDYTPGAEAGILETMVGFMIIMMVMSMLMKTVTGHQSIHGPERDRLVSIYGSWAVGRAESVCPEGDVQCVEREAAEFLTKFKASRWP